MRLPISALAYFAAAVGKPVRVFISTTHRAVAALCQKCKTFFAQVVMIGMEKGLRLTRSAYEYLFYDMDDWGGWYGGEGMVIS